MIYTLEKKSQRERINEQLRYILDSKQSRKKNFLLSINETSFLLKHAFALFLSTAGVKILNNVFFALNSWS